MEVKTPQAHLICKYAIVNGAEIGRRTRVVGLLNSHKKDVFTLSCLPARETCNFVNLSYCEFSAFLYF